MRESAGKPNIIKNLTFDFALEIIRFTEQLEGMRKYNLASQLFRSGTSIGANIREAQNAESLPDFIHKFKISAKEADETEYWLLLCKYSESYPDPLKLLCDLDDIKKISTRIIATSKNKLKSLNNKRNTN